VPGRASSRCRSPLGADTDPTGLETRAIKLSPLEGREARKNQVWAGDCHTLRLNEETLVLKNTPAFVNSEKINKTISPLKSLRVIQ